MLSVTLKSHNKVINYNQRTLQLNNVKYGATLRSVMDTVNQYRTPDAQFTNLYNPFGREIPPNLWKLKILENMSLYVDRPISIIGV
jgi:hypothetical protein